MAVGNRPRRWKGVSGLARRDPDDLRATVPTPTPGSLSIRSCTGRTASGGGRVRRTRGCAGLAPAARDPNRGRQHENSHGATTDKRHHPPHGGFAVVGHAAQVLTMPASVAGVGSSAGGLGNPCVAECDH